MRDRSLVLGSLIVVIAASGFGLLGPLARFAYATGFDPLSFVAWRATFGLSIILVVIAVRASRGVSLVDPRRLSSADRLALLLAGLTGLALNVAMFYAFGLGSIAVVLLAFYTYPGLVAVAAAILGHERLDAARVGALLLALAGMVLVVAGGLSNGTDASTTVHPLGIALGLLAAACQTVFVTLSRGRYADVPAEQAMGWVLAVAAVGCGILAFVTGGPLDVVFRRPDALGLAAIAGLVAAGIPSVLFLVGIRAIGGTRAGILMLFEPLVGVTLAAILLGEGLTVVQLVGGAAIMAAAVLIQREARGPAASSIEPAAVAVNEPVSAPVSGSPSAQAGDQPRVPSVEHG